jgi:hypothetical protein
LVTRDSSRAVWPRQARSHLRDADPVLARLIDDRPAFDPRVWLAQLPPGKLREAGLSYRKISTLRDLAGRLTDGS